jgi:hypothetical protein
MKKAGLAIISTIVRIRGLRDSKPSRMIASNCAMHKRANISPSKPAFDQRASMRRNW